VVKINLISTVQHFFVLFEILRSLFADVDVNVRSRAKLLDKKLKEVIIGVIKSGSSSADACVPIPGRFI
jgi:Vacuolar 14 Fab1-binding region